MTFAPSLARWEGVQKTDRIGQTPWGGVVGELCCRDGVLQVGLSWEQDGYKSRAQIEGVEDHSTEIH